MAKAKKSAPKKLNPKEVQPFAKNLLDDQYSRLPTAFANREDEKEDMDDALLGGGLIGIHGVLGSGKTVFLQHLCYDVLKDQYPTVYLQLSAEAFPRPYSQIAAALLQSASYDKKKPIRLRKGLGLNLKDEAKRLKGELQKEVGLEVSFKPEVEIPEVAKFSVGSISVDHAKSLTLPQYDDRASLELLQKLIQHLETKTIFVLDDFHYLRRHRDNENYYQDFVDFAEKFSTNLRHRQAIFLITLDSIVDAERKKAEDESGGEAFEHTDEEIDLQPFTPNNVAELIERRLNLFSYTSRTRPRFSDQAIFLVTIAGKGIPRLILDVLRRALTQATRQKTIHITEKHVRQAISKTKGASLEGTLFKLLAFFLAHPTDSFTVKQLVAKRAVPTPPTAYRHVKTLSTFGFLNTHTEGEGRGESEAYSLSTIVPFS